MTNSTKITKISSIFLAAILVAGTITLSLPSFMNGAQAQEYYGIERDYKKTDKKDVSVKSIKCNNININVNGLELNLTSVPFLSGLLASEAHEGERGAASYGDGGQSGYDKNNNSFKFVCINNNNNTVVVGEEPPIPPVEDECAEDIESCFDQFTFGNEFELLSDALESEAGVTVEINGEDVTLRSFEDICSALEGLTFEQLQDAVIDIIAETTGQLTPVDFDLFFCIAEALDIPIVVPIPR